MSDKAYCYPPHYTVLKNKLGIRDPDQLDAAERLFVTERMSQDVPAGDFDLAHLQAIHRHLFQDVYAWAGEIRTVEIAKGGSQFQPRQFIETGMADVHRRLAGQNYLQGRDPESFAREAGRIIGDVNYVHPFREGNGRTQFEYLAQLAERAGHPLDLKRITPEQWISASRSAHQGEYDPISQAIGRAMGCLSETKTDAGRSSSLPEIGADKAAREVAARLRKSRHSAKEAGEGS